MANKELLKLYLEKLCLLTMDKLGEKRLKVC